MIATLLKSYCTCDLEGKRLLKDVKDNVDLLNKERAGAKKVIVDMIEATKDREVRVTGNNNQHYILRLKKKKTNPPVTSAIVKRVEQLVLESDFKQKVLGSHCTDPLDSLCDVIVNETCPQSVSDEVLDVLKPKKSIDGVEAASLDLEEIFRRMMEKTEEIAKRNRSVRDMRATLSDKKKEIETKLVAELEKCPEPVQKVTMKTGEGGPEHFYLRVKNKKAPAKKKLSRGVYAKLTKGVLDEVKAEFHRVSRENTIEEFTKEGTLNRFLETLRERIRAKEAISSRSNDEKRISLDRVRAPPVK